MVCFLGREPNARREAKKKMRKCMVCKRICSDYALEGGVYAARFKPRMNRGVFVRRAQTKNQEGGLGLAGRKPRMNKGRAGTKGGSLQSDPSIRHKGRLPEVIVL